MPAASLTPRVALVIDAGSDADGSWARELAKQVGAQGLAATWIISHVDQVALLPGNGEAARSVGVRLRSGAVAELCAAIDCLQGSGAEVDTVLSSESIPSNLVARLAALGIRAVISESPAAADLRLIGSGIWQAGIGVSIPAARGLAALLKKSPRKHLTAHRSGLLVAKLDLRSAYNTTGTRRETTRLIDWLAEAPNERYSFQSMTDIIRARDAHSIGRPQRSILRAA